MEKAILRILALATLALALGACAAAGRNRPAPDPAAERGRAVAQRACAACHAVAPGGVGRMAKAPPFAGLEMRHTAALSGRVAELTRQGHYQMPPMALTPGEVSDLVSYIASLEPGRGGP